MTPDEYFGDWISVLDRNLISSYQKGIIRMYNDVTAFEPKPKDVFKAFRLCSKENCKVVIIGQDPYPQSGVATGIAFANKAESEKLSPSLNVLIDSVFSLSDNPENCIFDVTLESWEKQGILLLNSALTVLTREPMSHQKQWFPFIDSFIEKFSKENPNIFWVLFGGTACSHKYRIAGNHDNVVTEYHPSYFARNKIPMGNWMWKKMLDWVHGHYNINLKLYG